jgi:hypothetical protein
LLVEVGAMLDGALTFARFAYPPNELGYCGPDANRELLERISSGAVEPGLSELVRGFAGAWPYLELIAAANRISDPLDSRVVEAYWIGNQLLELVPTQMFARSLTERFHPVMRRGSGRERLLEPLANGALPHHGFHVFGVYPWVGLLRTGRADEPLSVLDRCRVRWGCVESVAGDDVVVASRPLQWCGGHLELGQPRAERVLAGRDGFTVAQDLRAGDWCALHWGWVCQPLTERQLRALRYYTYRQLAAVNAVAYSPPAAVLA